MRTPPTQRLLFSLVAAMVLMLCAMRLTAFRTGRGVSGAMELRAQDTLITQDAVMVGSATSITGESRNSLVRTEQDEGHNSSIGIGPSIPEGEGPREIKYIALIAERHSGSTWMTRFLRSYFKGKEVVVTSTLCTWKHWFQDRIHEGIQASERPCREGQLCPACLDIEHTLVVAMWRNPYDWISGMNKIPHHAKAHAGIADLSKFMTKRWMINPANEQKRRDQAHKMEENMEACMDNFLPSEVVPCNATDRSAIYELDPDGSAYANIYELRKAKIKDFDAVEAWAPSYEKIQYENILVGTALRDWLHSLQTKYGLAGNWKEVPNVEMAEKMRVARAGMYYLSSAHCSPLCTFGGMDGVKAVETLHGMWDEELESSVGYHQVG